MKLSDNLGHPRDGRRVRGGLVGGLAAALLGITGTLMAASPASAAAVDANPGPNAVKAIRHQVPRVPLTIDGTSVSPHTITRYNGRPLYTAVLPGGSPKGRLVVFTRRDQFERFVSQHGGPTHALATPPAAASPSVVRGSNLANVPSRGSRALSAPSNYAYIFEHEKFGGAWLGLRSGYGIPDLRQWYMRCNPSCANWNDQTTGVWADTYRGQIIFEHIRYEGSALWFSGGWYTGNLTDYGWNDRVSSFVSR